MEVLETICKITVDMIAGNAILYFLRYHLSVEGGASSMKRFYKNYQAFTLVELLVVTAVLGVLALMSIQTFNQYTKTVKENRCIADIRTLDKSLVAYYLDRNNWPQSLQDAGVSNQLDPWMRPYEYQLHGLDGVQPLEDFIGDKLNNFYDLYSKGLDGLSAVDSSDATAADDVVSTNDGQHAGMRAVLGL